MSITVTPSQFSLVLFDASAIADAVGELVARLGLADVDVVVEVDETSPQQRVLVEPGEPLVVKADSGALEDTKRPRQWSRVATHTNIGRALLRHLDRARGFEGAPGDRELSLAQLAAWDVLSVGRLGRAEVPVNEQRWRYHFRNRHGFTDAADRAFDRIWAGEPTTWDELVTISEDARQATPA